MGVFPDNTDAWLLENGPHNAVAVSSRARLARNLPAVPFAPRANDLQLRHTAKTITEALGQIDTLAGARRLDLHQLSFEERCFLRESHLISTELEKGGIGRLVFLSPSMDSSIMVNEEDHLRLTTLASGLRLREVYQRLVEIEEALERVIDFAYSEEFGYLTACPTNVGTGLRLSVMLHLPALVMIGQAEEVLAPLANFGLVVRGAYGENSPHSGDLFQISNEVTLGKTENQVMEILEKLVGKVVEHETMARESLLRQRHKIEDDVFRAIGLLSTARSMASGEALQLLSRARFGVGQDWGVRLRHAELSRLFVQVQPAHLQYLCEAGSHPEARDRARAGMLRQVFGSPAHPNN